MTPPDNFLIFLPPALGIALALAAPLLAAVLLLWPAARAGVRRLAPLAALPALLLALSGTGDAALELPWLLLGSGLGLDPTGRVFLLFTAWLWLIAAWFAGSYLVGDRRAHYFLFFFLLAQAGNFGLILARDLISFNLFFALMGLSAYGLVIHSREPAARRAGRIYLTLVLLGEVLIFTGLVGLIFTAGGLLEIHAATTAAPLPAAFGFFLLLGFGVKAGLLPVHFWLPLAHPAAPIPASSVLSGAMIKAGLLGWLRFLAPPDPTPAASALPDWGPLLVLLGLAAAFYGAGMGMTRQEPKTVLAWSSISQMGLITTALGLGLSTPAVYPQALETVKFYALHHGLAKGALFLAVALVAGNVIRQTNGPTNGSGFIFAGKNQALPVYPLLVAVMVLLPALSLAGAPFTSGFLAKEQLLATGRAAALTGWPIFSPGLWSLLLGLSGIATTLLLLRFLALLRQQWQQAADSAAAPVPWGMLVPWTLLALSGLPLLWPLFMPAATGLTPAAGPAVNGGKIMAALAPLLIALALARLLGRWWPAKLDQRPPVPQTPSRPAAAWAGWTDMGRRLARKGWKQPRRWRQNVAPRWRELGRRLEEQLGAWPQAGCCCLLLILVFFYLLL